MVKANVAIINELKQFLFKNVTNNQYKRPTSFTRQRILTFPIMVVLLLNNLKRSLSVEIQDFFNYLDKGINCSKQAFSKRRIDLFPQFFYDWNNLLTESFYRHYGPKVQTWKGKLLYAIDGSSFGLPPTKELQNKYGTVKNQYQEISSQPIARVGVLYDSLNCLIIKGLLHPYKVSEEDVVLTLLEDLPQNNVVLLFDRGYPSFWLIFMLMHHKQTPYFVMRVQKNFNKVVKDFAASGQMDCIIEIASSYRSGKRFADMGIKIEKNKKIKIRIVKVLLDTGETEMLITNLYDKSKYTVKDLKDVYFRRWAIETFYGDLKNQLQLEQFSGIRSICIEQDFRIGIFLFNLQALIEKQTQGYVKRVSKKRKHQYRINRNVSWACLKYRVIKIFIGHSHRDILKEIQQHFERNLEPIRPGRKFKRVKKRKPDKKFYTLTNYKRAL